jgi:hypothetical protein
VEAGSGRSLQGVTDPVFDTPKAPAQ